MDIEKLKQFANGQRSITVGITVPAHLLADAIDEIERLRVALQDIVEMTDADEPESYRADDSEGCLDTVFSVATEALMTPNVELRGCALLRSPA